MKGNEVLLFVVVAVQRLVALFTLSSFCELPFVVVAAAAISCSTKSSGVKTRAVCRVSLLPQLLCISCCTSM